MTCWPKTVLCLLCAYAAQAPRVLAQAEDAALRTAAEIQALSGEEAARQREVRLRGVVTFTWHTETSEFTLQDATGGVLFPAVPLPRDCSVGAEVEVEGRTMAGGFGPVVQPEVIRVLGRAALPEPAAVTYEQLLAPQIHWQRVEIEGVVRGQRVYPDLGLDWLALEIATGGSRLTVHVTHEITGHPELIDARVRVRGVVLHASDPQQQAFIPMLCAGSMADIELLDPAREDPFDQPVAPLSHLLRSAESGGSGHRVRVRGAVTCVRKDGAFFLQDATRGIEVFSRQLPTPMTGEAVDVVGFPEPGRFSPVMRDADWQLLPARASAGAIAVSVAQALRHDGRLVTLEAKLLDTLAGPDGIILNMEEGERRFSAHLPIRRDAPEKLPLDAGGILRLTGVCSVRVGNWESFVTYRQPAGFQMLLRSPADITVVHAAPFWTPTRVAWLLLGCGLALAGALTLLWSLSRKRLRAAHQAREAARVQFFAIFNERSRLAREIHDTQAQGLAAIATQVEAINCHLESVSEPIRRHLGILRELARESLAEARRSVWNLRSQSLEERGLAGSLEHLGKQLTDASAIDFTLSLEGTPRVLPVDTENNLLRIFQEALSNAVRHSGARHIGAKLHYGSREVHLQVDDDGWGFDPAAVVTTTQQGGFGLAGMRDRAEALHAEMAISSSHGKGTTVEITVYD